MKFFKKGKNQFISQVTILSIIFGFAAGLVGQIVADVYIDPWRQDYVTASLNTNTNTLPSIPELRRVKTFLGIDQDFQVNKSIEKLNPAMVGIYLKKSAGQTILNQIYLPTSLKANGFILTSDGWLVSFGDVFADYNQDQLVVVYEGKVFDIEESITDSTTGVVFLKIPANNLPVVVLGDSEEAILGQLAIVLNERGEAMVVNIKDVNYQDINLASDFLVSSENYAQSILLAEVLDKAYLGSPLVNLGGEVIGIIQEVGGEKTTAIPINQFRSIVLDVLRSKIVKRPMLGVEYIDLAWAVGLSEENTFGLNYGALVLQNPKANTPAGEAGITAGDIIISIDGQQVNKNSSLTELVQQYQAGDEINLEIVRVGNVSIKTVTLVILPD